MRFNGQQVEGITVDHVCDDGETYVVEVDAHTINGGVRVNGTHDLCGADLEDEILYL